MPQLCAGGYTFERAGNIQKRPTGKTDIYWLGRDAALSDRHPHPFMKCDLNCGSWLACDNGVSAKDGLTDK